MKVEPLLARQLYYFAQQNSGHFLRGYDLPEHISSPEDYHRSIRHSSIQEWKNIKTWFCFIVNIWLWQEQLIEHPFFLLRNLGIGTSVQRLRISAKICVENPLRLIDRWAYSKTKDGLQGILRTIVDDNCENYPEGVFTFT